MTNASTEQTAATSASPPGDDTPRYIHSEMWDRLVESEEDLPGIVAYGLYQRRKREWIGYYQSHHGHLPPEDQVKNYSAGQRDTASRALKDEARGILFRFGAQYAQEQLPDLQSQALNAATLEKISEFDGKLTAIRQRLENRTGLGYHLWTHITAFIIVVGLVALIAFAGSYELSPKEVSHKVINLFSGKADAPSSIQR
jgi:hypothetical protein